jgi:hypothetical protein
LTLKVCCVPSALAHVIVAGPVCTADAGGMNKDVPITIKNAASTLLFLTKKEIDFVNAGFQSIHLVFNGTAPVRSQFIEIMLYKPTNNTSKRCCNCYD